MTIYRLMLPLIAALFLVVAPARAEDDDDDCIEEFDVDWFIEINSTDGDAGVQLLLDGEQWKQLEIEGPDEREVLIVKTKRSLRAQGLTEFFFESAEPSFAERSLAEFLGLFPEGDYEFDGTLRDGGEICAVAELSHNLPGAPEIEAHMEADNLVISWAEADGSLAHPEAPMREISVESYEVIAEVIDGDVDFRMVLPADATEVTLPPEFLDDAVAGEDVIKYEVICKEETGNQTISEATFAL